MHDNRGAGDRLAGLFDTNHSMHLDEHFQRNINPRRLAGHDFHLILLDDARADRSAARRQFCAWTHENLTGGNFQHHETAIGVDMQFCLSLASHDTHLLGGNLSFLAGDNRDGHSAKQFALYGDHSPASIRPTGSNWSGILYLRRDYVRNRNICEP